LLSYKLEPSHPYLLLLLQQVEESTEVVAEEPSRPNPPAVQQPNPLSANPSSAANDAPPAESHVSRQPSSTTGTFGRLIHRAKPVHETHGRKWYSSTDVAGSEVKEVVERSWYVTDENGFKMGLAMDPPPYQLTPHLKAFLIMMSPSQIQEELQLMNQGLRAKGKKEMTMGELLKIYGVNILVTRLCPHDRRNLWGEQRNCKYVEPNDLCRTGMTRHRYEEMFSCWEFSDAPDERPDSSTY
jgi:hypothetical protein